MFNSLIIYVLGTAIIAILLSFLYKKGDVKSGNRAIRIVLFVMGSLFLAIFLFGIGLIIWNKDFKDYRNAILPLSIMFFTASLLFSLAIFKKDFSGEFKESNLAKSKESGIVGKKINAFLWILWISTVISVVIALKTYNMVFFILAGFLFLIIMGIKFKRGY